MGKLADLAYLAGKPRQSARTGFVHGAGSFSDTVSIYDNFCYAYALLAQKKAEPILEAKALLFRLVAFQSPEGNFPVYLHDFPRCYDLHQGLKIAPFLLRMTSEYRAVLGGELNEKISVVLSLILSFYQDKQLSLVWEFRRQICLKKVPTSIQVDLSDLWEHWISLQFIETPVCDIYYQELGLVPALSKAQDQFEPVPHLVEWACAASAGYFPPRLQKSHPNQLHLCALEKIELQTPDPTPVLLLSPFKLYWKGSQTLHTLFLTAKSIQQESEDRLIIELPSEFELGREDLYELSFYCDASPETQIYIDGTKGTVFTFAQFVQISTPTLCIRLQFHLLEGKGDFCGHVTRSNRPEQIACVGPLQYEAFDWKIGLRTLRRTAHCKLQITYSLSSKE